VTVQPSTIVLAGLGLFPEGDRFGDPDDFGDAD
jgi:hypothetical protein